MEPSLDLRFHQIKSADVKVDEKAVVKDVAEETEKKKVVAKPKVASRVEKGGKVKKKEDPNAYKVISFPLISEKATDLAMIGKYVFVVPKSSNKSEIQKAVESIYGVKVIKLNIIQKQGKRVRAGRKFGKQKDIKKAIVTIAKGQKIEVYEGV